MKNENGKEGDRRPENGDRRTETGEGMMVKSFLSPGMPMLKVC